MLKRIGKIAVVVVGLAGAAGVLSHQHAGDGQHNEQQWVARPGAPEPDHGQHDEWGGPKPPELPRGVRIATRSEVNGELGAAPVGGTTSAARALLVVGLAFMTSWALRSSASSTNVESRQLRKLARDGPGG